MVHQSYQPPVLVSQSIGDVGIISSIVIGQKLQFCMGINLTAGQQRGGSGQADVLAPPLGRLSYANGTRYYHRADES